MNIPKIHFTAYFLVGAVVLAVPACVTGDEFDDNDDDDTTRLNASAGSGTSQGSGGQGGQGGNGQGASSGQGGNNGWCPTAVLEGSFPITYNGDTTGAPNLVRSDTLEWDWSAGNPPTTDGDDALVFVAPETGTYSIEMPTGPGQFDGCGLAISDGGPTPYYDSSWCPAPGVTREIVGGYSAFPGGPPFTVTLTQGQEVMMWIGCASWDTDREGPYSVVIDQL